MPVTSSAIIGAANSAKQTLGGEIQAAIGFFGGRKAKKELENLQTPTYTPSKSITDYYNEALRRYQESPYQSNLYKMQAQNIMRGTQQGLAGLQDRRSALAGVSGLVQAQNDALLKAGVAAEQQQNQRFGQYGAASNAMAGEQRQAFNINQMLPYQKQYNILSQKAAGYSQLLNAGLQNMWGGGQAASTYGSGLGSMSSLTGSNNLNSYGQDRYLPPDTYKIPLASIS
jgi:hypothetical protein